MKAYQIAKI